MSICFLHTSECCPMRTAFRSEQFGAVQSRSVIPSIHSSPWPGFPAGRGSARVLRCPPGRSAAGVQLPVRAASHARASIPHPARDARCLVAASGSGTERNGLSTSPRTGPLTVRASGISPGWASSVFRTDRGNETGRTALRSKRRGSVPPAATQPGRSVDNRAPDPRLSTATLPSGSVAGVHRSVGGAGMEPEGGQRDR